MESLDKAKSGGQQQQIRSEGHFGVDRGSGLRTKSSVSTEGSGKTKGLRWRRKSGSKSKSSSKDVEGLKAYGGTKSGGKNKELEKAERRRKEEKKLGKAKVRRRRAELRLAEQQSTPSKQGPLSSVMKNMRSLFKTPTHHRAERELAAEMAVAGTATATGDRTHRHGRTGASEEADGETRPYLGMNGGEGGAMPSRSRWLGRGGELCCAQ